MKPKRYKPEFAIQAYVEADSRRFRFPDLDTLPTAGVPSGGGGAFSIQIAASDGPQIEKDKADIIADPTDGGAAIQTAADQLHEFGASSSKGGRIILGSGIFNVPTAGVLSLGDNITLEGTTPAESIIRAATANSGTILTMGENSYVRGVSIVGGGGTSVGVQVDDVSLLDWVHFFSLGTAIIPGNQATISRCMVPLPAGQPVGVFVDATSGWIDLIIANNQVVPRITLGASTNVLVAGNNLQDDLIANGGEQLVVIGNYRNSDASSDPINFANVDEFIVADNQWGDAGGGNGMVFDTCTDGTVEGNYVKFTDIGILADACTRVSVQGNSIEEPGQHGVQLVDSDDCVVAGNLVFAAGVGGSNTFDAYNIAGDRNLVHGNKSIPSPFAQTTRYGINIVSGNDNAVYANYLGDSSAYGTADSVDNGTNTQTTPAAGAIGGQWAF